MKEYVFIFRSSRNPHANPSAAQVQERTNWMGGVVAGDQLVDNGNRLSAREACLVKSGGVVADGPYTADAEFVNGYMIVKAASIGEAVKIAGTNPILKAGGNIEVRAVIRPGESD